jgi:hypothetical protein
MKATETRNIHSLKKVVTTTFPQDGTGLEVEPELKCRHHVYLIGDVERMPQVG